MDGDDLITAADFIAELRQAGMEIRDDCELCDLRQPVVARFDVLPHSLTPGSPILLTDFGVCGDCRQLIDADRWEEILQRWTPGSAERQLLDGYQDNLLTLAAG